MAAETNKFEGIILRTYPFGEADLILKVLSPINGKRSVIAKNVRREKTRFKMHIDIFDQGMLEVRETRGTLEPLIDFRSLRSFPRIRSDIDTLIVASLIVECFDLLVHENAAEAGEFYETLSLGLQALEEARSTRHVLKACFLSLHTLLQVAGYGSDSLQAPSLKKLYLLIDQIERACEKELATKSSVFPLLAQWGKTVRIEQSGAA